MQWAGKALDVWYAKDKVMFCNAKWAMNECSEREVTESHVRKWLEGANKHFRKEKQSCARNIVGLSLKKLKLREGMSNMENVIKSDSQKCKVEH